MRGWRDFLGAREVLDFSVEMARKFQIVWTTRGEVRNEI
jgi:hypothetical protein